MAKTYKVLGQAAPSATTETDLYTVPALTQTVVSSLSICNRHASTVAYVRIAICVGGGGTVNKDYLYYDVLIPAASTLTATLGITLATTDKIKCYADTANVSFQAFGEENT